MGDFPPFIPFRVAGLGEVYDLSDPEDLSTISLDAGADIQATLAGISLDTERTVINLAPGDYNMPTHRTRLQTVELCGDDRVPIGMSYIHGAKSTGLARNLIFGDLDPTKTLGHGTGVSVAIAGSTVTVTFLAAAIAYPTQPAEPIVQPDFSTVSAGDTAYFVDTAGVILTFTVASASGNSITFTTPIGLPSTTDGVGFVLNPTVRWSGTGGRIQGPKCTFMKGIHLNATLLPGFALGAQNAFLEHCVSLGNFANVDVLDAHQPNTFLGTYTNPAGCTGRHVFSGTIGAKATHFWESNPYSLYVFSAIAAADGDGTDWGGSSDIGRRGIGLGNGGQVCVAVSDFIGCPTRAIAADHSSVNIQVVGFNQAAAVAPVIALELMFGACAYSAALPGFPFTGLAPTFTGYSAATANAVVMDWNSIISCPGLSATSAAGTIIRDGAAFTTLGAIATPSAGANFSIVNV